ncbi:MAG: hypothetical protein COB13_006250 [OCS116 cluster bacterium]|nr:hypothetical protein [OCS116 cluster bacterium]
MADDFKPNAEIYLVERYKYILQEIAALNARTPKYLLLFQSLTTAIFGGGVAVFLGWKNLNISFEIAQIGIEGLLWLFTILAFFVIVSIVVGMVAWMDYRQEEVELLEMVVKIDFRKAPKWRNFWRWSETYLILIIIFVTYFAWAFVNEKILPLIA